MALEIADRAQPRVEVIVEILRRRFAFGGKQTRMHALDQHRLVMRAVENRDRAALGQERLHAPQKVMRLFQGRRLLERGDAAALRIDRAHHMFDRAVLAGRVHALKHDEQAIARRREQPLMHARDALGMVGERGLVVSLGLIKRFDFGRPVLEVERLALLDDQRVRVDLHSRPLPSSRRAIFANFLTTLSRLSLDR